MRLTLRQRIQSHCGIRSREVERGEGLEISEAFGHQISKIRNQENKKCKNVSHFQEGLRFQS